MHLSDAHLGRSLNYLGSRASDHAERMGQAWQRACQLAQSSDYALVVVAGDLFDSPRIPQKWINLCLDAARAVYKPVIVIPGNHDPTAQHPFMNRSLPPNLHFQTQCEPLHFPSLDLTILPCPHEHRALWSHFMKRDPEGARWQIAVVHGSMPTADREGDLTPALIAQSELDYIALGDWHSPRDFSQGRTICWYSGAPEMVMPDQQLPGCALKVTLRASAPASVEKIATGKARFAGSSLHYEVDLSIFANYVELMDHLSQTLTPETVAKISLSGRWHSEEWLDETELERAVQSLCLYATVENKALTDAPAPETPLEQVFTHLVQERMRTAPDQHALYEDAQALGMRLLRGGRL